MQSLLDFNSFLSRFDDEIISQILDARVLQLLTIIDPQLRTRTNQVKLAVKLNGQHGLLLDKNKRAMLIQLLRPDEARELAHQLEVYSNSSDIYENLSNARIHKNSDRETRLFEFFGLEPPKHEESLSPSDITTQPSQYELFQHQREAARKVQQYLNAKSRQRVVLHMPTGSGKTRTTMSIICDHLRQHEPAVVVWLAHSEELCDQAADEFSKAWHFLGNREVSVYRFWGQHDLQADEVKDGLMVAGLAKTFSRLKRDISFITHVGPRTTFIIIDEAHSAIADTYSTVLEALFMQNNRTALLGLTATPGRTWADIGLAPI